MRSFNTSEYVKLKLEEAELLRKLYEVQRRLAELENTGNSD